MANARGLQAVQRAGLNTTNSYEELLATKPGELALFQGQYLGDGEYQTTVGAEIQHPFLSALGIGNSYAQRIAVAKASPTARMGGASNYLGTNGISYDWLVRNEAYQSGSTERKDYYNTLWQKYVRQRCDQSPTPAPCIGSFWLNMLGPEANHQFGDAYTPLGDGTVGVASGGPYAGLGGVVIPVNLNNDIPNCKRVSDIQSWFYTLADGAAVCDTAANNPNIVNKDRHPDANGVQGFGYSIGITIDQKALYPYTNDPNQISTSFKVSIYDAAMSDVGNGELFGTGDNYYTVNNPYGPRPDNTLPYATSYNDKQRPADGSSNSRGGNKTINCITNELPAVAGDGQSRKNRFGQVISGGAVDQDNQYCQNGLRTRFSLYYPSENPFVTTNWKNKGGLVAAWEATELSTQNDYWMASSTTGGAYNGLGYCYYADTSFDKATGTFANPKTSSVNTNLVTACPSGQANVNLDDIYWNATPDNSLAFTEPVDDPGTSSYYQGRLQGLTVDPTRFDPSQGCRSLVDPNLYDNDADYQAAINLTGPVPPPYRNTRIPWNMRGADPRFTGSNALYTGIRGFGILSGGYQSYHGWRCSWDFDSNNVLNPGFSGFNSLGSFNSLRRSAEGITNQPYLYISDYGYVPGDPDCSTQRCRISYQDGVRQKGIKSDSPNVRGGTYLLQVQIFGGGGANRFAVKAEYDNPQPVNAVFVDPGSGQTVTSSIWPTPMVYPITAVSQLMQISNSSAMTSNIIFDMAYIPRTYAGRLVTQELFDIGDAIADLTIEILQPSGYGQKLNNGAVPYDPSQRLLTRPIICPSQSANSPFPRGASMPCIFPSVSNYSMVLRSGGQAYFNDQWLYLVFTVPNAATYDTIQATCFTNRVPDNECYIYQLNYQLLGFGYSYDSMTWQLSVPNLPVRLK